MNEDLLLIGVLLFTGKDEDLLDESIAVTFDRATTTVKVLKDRLQVAVSETVMTTAEGRVLAADETREISRAHSGSAGHSPMRRKMAGPV